MMDQLCNIPTSIRTFTHYVTQEALILIKKARYDGWYDGGRVDEEEDNMRSGNDDDRCDDDGCMVMMGLW